MIQDRSAQHVQTKHPYMQHFILFCKQKPEKIHNNGTLKVAKRITSVTYSTTIVKTNTLFTRKHDRFRSIRECREDFITQPL